MADLEHNSSVGGYPIIHEGNVNYTQRDLNYTENMVSKTYCDGRFNRVFDDRDTATPKNGDILIERGPIISIYNDGWNEVFFSNEEPPLVTSSSFLFQTLQEALLFQNSNVPLDPEEILDSWPRASAGNYYATPEQSVGESADWFFDGSSFVQPNNSVSVLTLLSPIKTDTYTFEAILTSQNGDDDLIGLVISADNDGDDAYQVIAWVNAGGFGANTFYITYSSPTVTSNVIDGNSVIANHNNSTGGTGWSGKQIRMRIQRNGNIVSAKVSDWDDVDNILDESELIINLSNIPIIEYPLNGLSRYGFATRSQSNSTYLDFNFRSADYNDENNIYSIERNSHWKYINETWVKLSTSATDDLANVDFVINPFTKEKFKIENNQIELIENNGINYDDVSFDFSGDSGGVIIPASSILNRFSYTESISIIAVYNDVNSNVSLTSSNDISVMLGGNGSFYVLLSTEVTITPEGNKEKTIAYRKINYIN